MPGLRGVRGCAEGTNPSRTARCFPASYSGVFLPGLVAVPRVSPRGPCRGMPRAGAGGAAPWCRSAAGHPRRCPPCGESVCETRRPFLSTGGKSGSVPCASHLSLGAEGRAGHQNRRLFSVLHEIRCAPRSELQEGERLSGCPPACRPSAPGVQHESGTAPRSRVRGLRVCALGRGHSSILLFSQNPWFGSTPKSTGHFICLCRFPGGRESYGNFLLTFSAFKEQSWNGHKPYVPKTAVLGGKRIKESTRYCDSDGVRTALLSHREARTYGFHPAKGVFRSDEGFGAVCSGGISQWLKGNARPAVLWESRA